MNEIKRFTQSELHGNSLYAQKAVAHSSETHWHEFYEITYYPDATGEAVVNNVQYPITPGTLFLLTPLDFHSANITSTKSSECYKIYFLDNQFEVGLVKYLGNPIILHDVEADSFICSVLKELCSIQPIETDPEYITVKLQNYLLKSLIIKTFKNSGAKNPSQQKNALGDLVKNGITYITSHFSEDPSLDEVAKITGVSPNYFSKIFKSVTGTTFQFYITNLKINYAKQLLAESDFSVSDISSRSGFNNLSNFLRSFKRSCGETPTEYRTNYRASK